MNIKPIETHYKGYRFRSRTEARWAVFFDKLGLTWEYEKEGFDLGGKYYLPDFWLPQVWMWAEVKGEEFTPAESDLCRLLAKATDRKVLMLDGPPEYKAYFFHDPIDSTQVVIGDCYLTAEYLDENRFFSYIGEDLETQREWLKTDSFYVEAISAARGARFEHGENTASGTMTQFRYTYDGESGECAECGRSIQARFRLCYSCDRAYADY